MKPMLIIAIDPDVDKNGIAILNVPTREVKLLSLNFPETIEFLFEHIAAHQPNEPLAVCIEAGWLNKPNFHLYSHDRPQVAAAKGRSVGRNEQVSRCLIEYSQWLADKQNTPLIAVHTVKPLAKCWRGKDHKITHEELAYFVQGLPTRTNQEERDAVLIAWTHANLPTRINQLSPTQNRLSVQQFKQLLTQKTMKTHILRLKKLQLHGQKLLVKKK